MKKANYIILHPERARVEAEATILNREKEIIEKWIGEIFVDRVNENPNKENNEDPFVFNNPWIYSYCHASQLKRNCRKYDCSLQKGSIIVFVKGVDADKNILTIDTVFIVKDVLRWGFSSTHPQELPSKYLNIKYTDSVLWERHFKFPFPPFEKHKNVTHSYEAKLWDGKEIDYSFLPLNQIGKNVSIPFSELEIDLSDKLNKKKKGKYPVLIEDDNLMKNLMALIESRTSIKVLKDIKFIKSLDEGNKGRSCSSC